MVEIVAAERRIAAGRQHLKHALLQVEQRDVEGAAAQVVDRVDALRVVVEAIGQRRRRRFVDQPQHLEPGQSGGVAGGGAGGVVEIGRHGDDRAVDATAELGLGAILQRAQDVGGNLDRRHCAASDI